MTHHDRQQRVLHHNLALTLLPFHENLVFWVMLFPKNQPMKTCVGLSFLYFSLGMTKIAFVVIKIIL
jgi:hypothetical protein